MDLRVPGEALSFAEAVVVAATKVAEKPTRPVFDPCLDLKTALEELDIDWKAPGFDEETLPQRFKELSEDKANVVWYDRDRYADIYTILC